MPDKIKRPEVVNGSTTKTKTGCGNLYVTLNKVDGVPFETFADMGKAGGCAASQTEAIGRLISMAFRHGIGPEEVVKQLGGLSCHEGGEGCKKSCADAFASVIKKDMESDKDKNAS